MADENTVDQDPIETGELPDEAADQDISTELPDDPAELKATAIQLRKDKADLIRSKRQVEERAEEHEATAIYNKGKVKDLEEQLANRTAEPQQSRKPKEKEPDIDIDSALPEAEWLDILADPVDGPKKLIRAIKDRVVKPLVRQGIAARESERQETTTEQAASLQKLAGPYPDLLKNGSELQAAASKHLIRIEREMKGLSPDAALIMATQAAALEIGYKPNQASNGQPSSERLRNAQSAPHGRKQDVKPEATQVDASIEKFAKKHGIPLDASSRKMIANLQAQNSRGAARK